MNDRKNTDQRDDALTERAARLFDNSVDDLDAATRSRLNRARQEALQAASTRPAIDAWKYWAPAGATAAVAALAVLLWNDIGQPDLPVAPNVATDLEILLDQDALEMLQELEFYSWMELDDGSTTDENVG